MGEEHYKPRTKVLRPVLTGATGKNVLPLFMSGHIKDIMITLVLAKY